MQGNNYILDSCYSGFMGSIDTVGHNTANINEGVTIMTASRNNQTSMEVNGHGVFTSLLLEALKDGAADVTGHISILRKLDKYFDTENSKYNLDPSFEPTNKERVTHEIVEPYAKDENIAIFSDLQKLEGIGLVVPVEEEHMYFAALSSKTCELTAVGKEYWRLVKEERI